MRHHIVCPLFAAVLACVAVPAWAGITPEEFAARRARLLALADTDAAIVLRAAEFRVRSGDVSYRYRQESNFLYLTGLEEPGLTLLLVPRGVQIDGESLPALLFAPAPRAAELAAAGGFAGTAVVDAGRFAAVFASVAGTVKTLYVSSPDMGFVNDWLNNTPLFIDQQARQRLRDRFPDLRVKNAGPLISPLRERKSPAEIALIRDAIRMTGDGIRRAAAICAPGRFEYELQAAVEEEMTRQGAAYTSFPSIIGSGENSVILHYDENRRAMRAGEVVVMDVGAEYDGYAADITRTIPVSGKFSEAEKKVYAVVLRAQEETIGIIRPGTPWGALERKAREVLAAAGFGRYMPHAVSHHVGVDVHDAGTYDTLRAGMVITVEPGIYVPASDTAMPPAFRGFGVRLEDDVLVTEGGAEVLSAGIPKGIEAAQRMAGAARRRGAQ